MAPTTRSARRRQTNPLPYNARTELMSLPNEILTHIGRYVEDPVGLDRLLKVHPVFRPLLRSTIRDYAQNFDVVVVRGKRVTTPFRLDERYEPVVENAQYLGDRFARKYEWKAVWIGNASSAREMVEGALVPLPEEDQESLAAWQTSVNEGHGTMEVAEGRPFEWNNEGKKCVRAGKTEGLFVEELPVSCVEWGLGSLLSVYLEFADTQGIHYQTFSDSLQYPSQDAFHVAVELNNLRLVKIFLDWGADPKHHETSNDETAVMVLCSRGAPKGTSGVKEAEIIRLLAAKGVDVNLADREGLSPLLRALERGLPEPMVKALIELGAKVECNEADYGHFSPLHYATDRYPETFWDCIKGDNSDFPQAALPTARGDLGVIRLLINASTDINAHDCKGETALFRAAGYLNVQFVELLLAAGADPNKVENDGVTPLHAACGKSKRRVENEPFYESQKADYSVPRPGYICQERVVRLLLHYGADPNANSEHGTPLHYAAYKGSHTVIPILLEAGADINLGAIGSLDTPLHAVVNYGRVLAFRELMNAGAQVDAKNQQGETPLRVAARNYQHHQICALVNKGADINAVSEDPQLPTALFQAARNEMYFMIDGSECKLTIMELLRHGANPSIVNNEGQTAETVTRTGQRENGSGYGQYTDAMQYWVRTDRKATFCYTCSEERRIREGKKNRATRFADTTEPLLAQLRHVTEMVTGNNPDLTHERDILISSVIRTIRVSVVPEFGGSKKNVAKMEKSALHARMIEKGEDTPARCRCWICPSLRA